MLLGYQKFRSFTLRISKSEIIFSVQEQGKVKKNLHRVSTAIGKFQIKQDDTELKRFE